MRKYLDDINVTDRPDTWCGDKDERSQSWKEQREKYGFDERETWSLDCAFFMWLYERVTMYKEVAEEVVDLTFQKFKYKRKEYSQIELINLLLEKLKFVLCGVSADTSFQDYVDYENKKAKTEKEICDIWNLILPAMWW